MLSRAPCTCWWNKLFHCIIASRCVASRPEFLPIIWLKMRFLHFSVGSGRLAGLFCRHACCCYDSSRIALLQSHYLVMVGIRSKRPGSTTLITKPWALSFLTGIAVLYQSRFRQNLPARVTQTTRRPQHQFRHPLGCRARKSLQNPL